MKSLLFRPALLLSFLVLSACGGGGGGGGGTFTPTSRAPTSNFAFSCTDLSCTFTSTSTDQDVGDAIASHSWNFGDGSTVATTANPTRAFAAAGTYDVSLRVVDTTGLSGSLTRQVVVTAPAVPAAPRAAFTARCSSLDCTFTDTSTYDPGSVFQSRAWNFGDGTTTAAATSPVSHTYAATTLQTYTVRLTVTDGAGKTSASTQTIVVAPPATTLSCVGGGCVLRLTQAARVTATLTGSSCNARANQVVLTAPVVQTLFPDGCFDPIGVPVSVNGGTVFAANTTLEFSVRSGTFPSSMLAFPPSVLVAGDFANGWTLTFDDGFGGPGEPDFNDLVIFVKATP